MNVKAMVTSEQNVPPFLKEKKKSLVVSWSDGDDLEEEVKNESAKNVTALTGRVVSDT